MDLLLVEPWLAGSHQAWAEGYAAASRHRVTVLAGEGAGWRSTLRDAGTKLATQVKTQPDAVLASSMFDAAEFRRQAGLEEVPLMLYMHENQLTYDPDSFDHELAMINWRSAKTADRLLFNSRFHLNDFFAALPKLEIEPGSAAAARDKSQVMPVGIDLLRLDGPPLRQEDRFTVLWNHRWEADKDPAAFVDVMLGLDDPRLHLILAGEQRENDPQVEQLVAAYESRVLSAGFAPEAQYGEALRMADIVVSTARQEFFGVSIAEAMYSGAIPLVPDRLAYPELIPDELHGDILYSEGELGDRLLNLADQPELLAKMRPLLREEAGRFDWSEIAGRYDDAAEEVTA